jgi:O-antigen/teichoic acid export membrane protein
LQALLWNTGPLVVSRYASAVLGLITTIAATRWLGVDGFGEASLAAAYPLLLWSITSVKSVSITTRYLSSFRASGDAAGLSAICRFGYLIDLIMATTAFAIVLLTGSLVATRVYRMPDIYGLMVLLAASFPLYSLGGTSEAILTTYSRFGALASLLIFENILRLALVLAAWGLGGSTTAFIGATAGSQVAAGVVGLWLASRSLSADVAGRWWQGGVRFAAIGPLKQELRQFFGWNYALVTVSGFVDQLPAMVLGAYRGTSAVAFYRLSMSLMVTVGYVEASLRRAVYPSLLADWNAGGLVRLRADVGRMTRRIGLPAGTAIVAAAILVTPLAVSLMFGESYRPMIPGAQLMIAGVGISTALFWLHPYYFAAGRVVLWSRIYVVYGIVFLGAAWPVSDAWGFFGVAVLVAVGRTCLIAVEIALTRSELFGRRT